MLEARSVKSSAHAVDQAEQKPFAKRFAVGWCGDRKERRIGERRVVFENAEFGGGLDAIVGDARQHDAGDDDEDVVELGAEGGGVDFVVLLDFVTEDDDDDVVAQVALFADLLGVGL